MRHSRLLRALFWTAGSNPDSIQVRRDVVRHSSIGLAVWLTAIISSAAAFIALQTVFFLSVMGSAAAALLWGLFVFNIDRMLVAGHTESFDDDGKLRTSRWSQVGVWGLRVFLSLLLALTITEPLTVRVFSVEIAGQLPVNEANAPDGFFTQYQALENYGSTHPEVAVVRWLLTALLLIVNMSAGLLKSLFRDGLHDHLEVAALHRALNRVQQRALEESRESHERAQMNDSTAESAIQNVDAQAINQSKIDQARRDADLDVALVEIEMDRAARIAQLQARRRAGPGTDDSAVSLDRLANAPALQRSDDRFDQGAQWNVYDRRWRIIKPLRTPPRPNTPWVVTDLRGEYQEDLVLKPLSPETSLPEEEAKARTRQAANQLSLQRGFVHRNVADILDAGYDERNGAFVVNHRYDWDLSEYLDARRHDMDAPYPFRVSDALGFSMQLAEGMCAVWIRMHRLHLDIKPSNVGVELGSEPVLKLMDFGLTARLDGLSPTGNDSHTPRGTQFYAAPEQWAEARADDPDVARLSVAADLRGLAATIYRMFVGQAPGYAEAAARGYLDNKGNPSADPRKQEALFRMLETEAPLPMDRLITGLPPGFVALIEQWLNVDPVMRNPGPSVDDPQAYGEQVLSSLRYHVHGMLADRGLADRAVSSLRVAAYRRGGPVGAATVGDDSTVDR